MTLDFDLIVVGDYCLDLIFTGLSGLPEMGKEIVASSFIQIPGGTYNTAVAAHRLGVKTGWACDFGTDEYSQYVVQKAREEGLPEDLFVMHRQPLRNVTVALSYPHDRAFVAFYDRSPSLPAGMKALARASARALYLTGLYTGPFLEAGLLAMRAKQIKLVMDGNSNQDFHLSDPAVRRAIRSADVFMPNAREATALTGENDLETAARSLNSLCNLVVIKNGAEGALAAYSGQIIRVPSIPASCKDTTGAGDCFNAGFLRAWLAGEPLEICLRWGNIAGGLSITELGGTGRVIRQEDIQEWMKFYD